jgi:hypothetical protein
MTIDDHYGRIPMRSRVRGDRRKEKLVIMQLASTVR